MMGRIIYSDGRKALTTTAFRYKLTDSAGTLVKDWTTGATWTEEPAGTYYLDDEDAVPGTYYAVEPATGQVGGAGMVPEPMRGTDGANTVEPDNATVQAIAADYAKTGEAAAAAASLGTPLQADDYTAPPTDYATAAALAAAKAVVDAIKAHTDTLDEATGTNTLTFRLLLDTDGDGVADDPAVGVVGITCHLLDSTGTTRIRESQTTDSQGYVYWHGLADGDYVVDPDDAAYEGVTVDVTLPE